MNWDKFRTVEWTVEEHGMTMRLRKRYTWLPTKVYKRLKDNEIPFGILKFNAVKKDYTSWFSWVIEVHACGEPVGEQRWNAYTHRQDMITK